MYRNVSSIGEITFSKRAAHFISSCYTRDAFHAFICKSIEKYVNGKWGAVTPERAKKNDYASISCDPLIAHYVSTTHHFDIIISTDSKREKTIIMFRNERNCEHCARKRKSKRCNRCYHYRSFLPETFLEG